MSIISRYLPLTKTEKMLEFGDFLKGKQYYYIISIYLNLVHINIVTSNTLQIIITISSIVYCILYTNTYCIIQNYMEKFLFYKWSIHFVFIWGAQLAEVRGLLSTQVLGRRGASGTMQYKELIQGQHRFPTCKTHASSPLCHLLGLTVYSCLLTSLLLVL